MTRKQYRRKMMQLQRNLNKYAKENGLRTVQKPDKVNMPNWGTTIQSGKYTGEKLISYAQCWDMITEVLKGTPALNGIN